MKKVTKFEFDSHIQDYTNHTNVTANSTPSGCIDYFADNKFIGYSIDYLGDYFIEKEYQLNNTTSELITQIHNWIDNMIYKVDLYMPFNYYELDDMLTRVSRRGTYTEEERDVLNFLRNNYITNNKKQKQKT